MKPITQPMIRIESFWKRSNPHRRHGYQAQFQDRGKRTDGPVQPLPQPTGSRASLFENVVNEVAFLVQTSLTPQNPFSCNSYLAICREFLLRIREYLDGFVSVDSELCRSVDIVSTRVCRNGLPLVARVVVESCLAIGKGIRPCSGKVEGVPIAYVASEQICQGHQRIWFTASRKAGSFVAIVQSTADGHENAYPNE